MPGGMTGGLAESLRYFSVYGEVVEKRFKRLFNWSIFYMRNKIVTRLSVIAQLKHCP